MWDLVTAKSRLGITDNLQDALLQTTLDTALKIAESYCDRQFMYATQRATFYHVHGDSLQLRRFPIEQIISLTAKNVQGGGSMDTPKYKAHHIAGLILFHAGQILEEVQIDYSGGYRILPEDVELALWMIFDQVWAMNQSGGGGGGLAAGAVESVTLQDVGTVRFATGAAASSGSGSSNRSGALPQMAAFLLDPYVLEKA